MLELLWTASKGTSRSRECSPSKIGHLSSVVRDRNLLIACICVGGPFGVENDERQVRVDHFAAIGGSPIIAHWHEEVVFVRVAHNLAADIIEKCAGRSCQQGDWA